MGRSREGNREYMRKYRAQKRAEAGITGDAKVTDIQSAASALRKAKLPVEKVEAATARELGMIARASEQPALVAQALALARVLDDPTAAPQYAPCSRQLVAILSQLRGGEVRGENKLAELRSRREETGGERDS